MPLPIGAIGAAAAGAGTAGATGAGSLAAILNQLRTPWWTYLVGPGVALGTDLFSAIANSFGAGDADVEWEKYQNQAALRQLIAMTQPRYSASQYQINPSLLHGMNEAVIKAIFSQLKRMGNFGFPEGMEIDWDFLEEILKQMQFGGGGATSPYGRTRIGNGSTGGGGTTPLPTINRGQLGGG